MSNILSVVNEKSTLLGFLNPGEPELVVCAGALKINFEASTMPNTVHCISKAKKSTMKTIKRFNTDVCVLLRNNFSNAGIVHTAFIMIIARATSIFGSTRNTNIEMPKL